MFRRFYVPKVLCSEGSIFRRFYIPKVLYSEGSIFRRFYIPKYEVLCSEGSIFRRFYIPKYEVLCSEGPIFRRSYILKVLYYKRFYIPKVLCSETLEGSIFWRFSMFQNFGFCSQSSSDAVVDDMDEIERVSESK